jgi:hypothetical protein
MKSALTKKKKLSQSGLGVYDELEINHELYYSNEEIVFLLSKELFGISTKGMPNRTRSKFVKESVCKGLGYATPRSFKKTQPRFPCQNFDTYIQKSNNLQIWNEEILSNRRYILILVNNSDIIFGIKVLTGEDLKLLDKTGTLTHKYQARLKELLDTPDLFSTTDSPALIPLLSKKHAKNFTTLPSDLPELGCVLPISEVAKKLHGMINKTFKNLARDQDRNRGTMVHKETCRLLGYSQFNDNGQFPDILAQLIEVKLQTSPTIDLGLVLPTSNDTLLDINGLKIRHSDVRYLIFEAEIIGANFKITNFALGTGADFFTRFDQFQGKVRNSKIQIPLPRHFFEC